MSSPIQQMPLTEMLAAAEAKRLAQGWVYLPDGEIAAASSCVLIADEAYDCEDEDELAKTGARLGFPREGLDTGTIEDVCDGVKQLCREPSDDLYVRAFIYYWKFDAFLPSADAPDPPPIEVVREKLDREFYTSLGPERAGSRCRREGCDRGAVNMSAFCGRHHFEMIYKRPYLFE